MGKMGDKMRKLYLMRCFTFQQPAEGSPAEGKAVERDDGGGSSAVSSISFQSQRKPGGWKSMPFIIGNETFERLATFGLLANFTVYLVNHLHFSQVMAVNMTNIWSGTTNFAPLLGAFLSDAYLGRFQTLAYSCIASLLGMVGLTLTASIPQLSPPPCTANLQQQGRCDDPPPSLMALLYTSLALLTVGAGGIRPCSLPFGVDQFDASSEEGRKGINSFFNWFYFTLTAAIMVAITLIVYIQNSISWALGLGIPAVLMLMSIVMFFLGTRVYVYVAPEGSVFSGIAQVVVAAYRKRSLKIPYDAAGATTADVEAVQMDGNGKGGGSIVYYDPVMPKTIAYITKLPLTQQFRFLNKAAVVVEETELRDDATPMDPWRLCPVQKVEELKCIIRIAPIWASGIICFVAMAQQGTFSVLQAMKMDRHLGPHFQIPPGSLGVISMLAMTLFIPIYDRLLVPAIAGVTKKEGGITVLQRMGVGMGASLGSMVVAGAVESRRREGKYVSALWLAPQLALMGLGEALNGVAQIEFYYKQFPEHMRSVAGALFFCSLAGSNYLSSLIISVVRRYTGWLADDIDVGRVDFFYYLLAGLGVLNLLYFVVCARFYRYKAGSVGTVEPEEDHSVDNDQQKVGDDSLGRQGAA